MATTTTESPVLAVGVSAPSPAKPVDPEQLQAPTESLPPLLVTSSVTDDDDDELLFEPDSPRGSRNSSGPGTPPTPEQGKIVWPSTSSTSVKVGEEIEDHDREEGQAEQGGKEGDEDEAEQRLAELTTRTLSFDLFVSLAEVGDAVRSEPMDLVVSPHNSILSMSAEDGDHKDRVSSAESSSSSPVSSSTSEASSCSRTPKIQTVKCKTKIKTARQSRDEVSRFQLKGGLVGWLHGENGGGSTTATSSDATGNEPATSTAPMERASFSGGIASSAPSRQRASSLFGNLYDKMKQKQEQLELKLQALDEPGKFVPQHQTTGTSTNNRPRLSLQPGALRKRDGSDVIGFDGFVSSAPPQKPVTMVMRRDSRLRSASSSEVYEATTATSKSSVRSRLQSLSFAARSSVKSQSASQNDAVTTNTQSSSTPSALQWDAFSMEDCLADPKLAAEFVNAVLPGDEWLLTLLYSIEEYETLTTTTPTTIPPPTTTTDECVSSPPLEAQILMALTIIDRFLLATQPTNRSILLDLDAMGQQIRATVVQYQSSPIPTAASDDSIAAAIAAQATALPMTLFDNVYTCVFDTLREAFDSKFRSTREYAQLHAHRIQQLETCDDRALHHLVLSFDQVVESEWCCTVFWVYLFRTAHHHRLSFIMDVKFKLRRLQLAAQQQQQQQLQDQTESCLPTSRAALLANQRLQHELLLICRRFLTTKFAALALPTTSPMLARLKEDLCSDAIELERTRTTASSEPQAQLAFMQRMIDKLDAMRTQTRVEFKRMSFERFASFLTSPLYRDFIVHPNSASSTQCTRADDLMQLLRVNRISFHQTAVCAPTTRELCELRENHHPTEHTQAPLFDKAIASVFAFQTRLGLDPQSYDYRSLYASPLETETSVASLMKTVESFLLPDSSNGASKKAGDPLCFNFLAGTGEATVYGAVWRYGVEATDGESASASGTVQGVCVLSRYPLIDGLREFLHTLAETVHQGETPVDWFMKGDADDLVSSLDPSRASLERHCSRLLNDPAPTGVLDTSLQDLFESLSIAHAMRLFSLILQEKKIVMVSSSYSVLLSVGEALRAIISPLVWSHIYVPVLPLAMKGYLHCPTPFIYGLHMGYARHCELPKPSDDLAVVNLDRDSITGGGDVFMPPLRVSALRDKLTALCKPRLRTRDQVSFTPSSTAHTTPRFPSSELCRAFHEELRDILSHLETFAFRFECVDRTISVVDVSNKSRQWPADAARFYPAVLQSQAFSTYLGCNSTN